MYMNLSLFLVCWSNYFFIVILCNFWLGHMLLYIVSAILYLVINNIYCMVKKLAHRIYGFI